MISMRQSGANTDFDAVEVAGSALLKSHPAPADQGLIHYRLAHIYAQTGLVWPDRILAHAEAALRNPLPDNERPRLGGSAVATRCRATSHAVCRLQAEAAKHYLEGLKEIDTRKLPLEAPDPPQPPGRMDTPDVDEREAHAAAVENGMRHPKGPSSAKEIAFHKEVMMRRASELTAPTAGNRRAGKVDAGIPSANRRLATSRWPRCAIIPRPAPDEPVVNLLPAKEAAPERCRRRHPLSRTAAADQHVVRRHRRCLDTHWPAGQFFSTSRTAVRLAIRHMRLQMIHASAIVVPKSGWYTGDERRIEADCTYQVQSRHRGRPQWGTAGGFHAASLDCRSLVAPRVRF